jgi:hypothetical protein
LSQIVAGISSRRHATLRAVFVSGGKPQQIPAARRWPARILEQIACTPSTHTGQLRLLVTAVIFAISGGPVRNVNDCDRNY